MPREYLEEESIKFFYKIVCVCVCVCSIVPDSATPWTVALQAPLSVGFSRQVYWSGLPFPTSGHLPDPGIEPSSLVSPVMAGGFFTTEPPRSDSILGLAGHRVSVGLPQVAQWVKNPSAKRETRVRSLGQEDPLEEGVATHSSIFAWRIPSIEEPDGLQSIEWQKVRHDGSNRKCTHAHGTS